MLTLSHWIYVLVVAAVIVAMVLRRDVVLICLLGTFTIGLVYTGSISSGLQVVFHSLMTGGTELFDIMLIIAIMVAMLKALECLGSDKIMMAPARNLMKTPTSAFFSIGIAMYLAALFFWPTPATALVGTVLIPVAVNSGLPAIYAAMSVNILGHGMGLAGDMVLQGAPNLAARAADVDVSLVVAKGAILSIVAGVVAIGVTYFMMMKDLKGKEKHTATVDLGDELSTDPLAIAFGRLVPLAFLVVIVIMVKNQIKGGDATAFLGGTGAAILLIATAAHEKNKCLERIVDHLREGFLFAIKIFSPVIPIAGFFFLGGGESAMILGEGAPKLLFDIGEAISQAIPLNKVALGFGNMVVGIITGLDGSGFSGIPLVGGLARALGGPAGVDVATLAAVGQMGAVWSGGGTLVAWAFGLAATAGVAGVSPLELARKNFIPVTAGLVASTIVGIILM